MYFSSIYVRVLFLFYGSFLSRLLDSKYPSCFRFHGAPPLLPTSRSWVPHFMSVGAVVVVGGCGRWCGCDLWERSKMTIMAFIYSRGLYWCRDISSVILNFLRRLKEDLLYAFSFLKQISLSTLNCWKVVFWNLARSKFIILSDYRSLIFDPLNTFYVF